MKQTAVEWLKQIYLQTNKIDNFDLEVAKEMEKEQIETAYNKAVPFKYGKEYYEETFNK